MADERASQDRPLHRSYEGHRLESQLCSLAYQQVWPVLRRVPQASGERLQRPAQNTAEVQRLEQAIVQHKRRIARLIDAYENGWLDKVEFEPRIRTAKERLVRDEAALLEHQRESIDAEGLRLVFGQFEAFAGQMAASLEQADFATKR